MVNKGFVGGGGCQENIKHLHFLHVFLYFQIGSVIFLASVFLILLIQNVRTYFRAFASLLIRMVLKILDLCCVQNIL